MRLLLPDGVRVPHRNRGGVLRAAQGLGDAGRVSLRVVLLLALVLLRLLLPARRPGGSVLRRKRLRPGGVREPRLLPLRRGRLLVERLFLHRELPRPPVLRLAVVRRRVPGLRLHLRRHAELGLRRERVRRVSGVRHHRGADGAADDAKADAQADAGAERHAREPDGHAGPRARGVHLSGGPLLSWVRSTVYQHGRVYGQRPRGNRNAPRMLRLLRGQFRLYGSRFGAL